MRWSPEDGEGGLRRVLLPRPLVRRKATMKSTEAMRYSSWKKPKETTKEQRRFLIKNIGHKPTASQKNRSRDKSRIEQNPWQNAAPHGNRRFAKDFAKSAPPHQNRVRGVQNIPRASAVQWVANPIHHGVRAVGRTTRSPGQHYFSMMSSIRTVKYGALRNVDSSNAPFTTASTVSPWYTVVIVEKSMKERSTG